MKKYLVESYSKLNRKYQNQPMVCMKRLRIPA